MRKACRATLGSMSAGRRSVLRNAVEAFADARDRAAQHVFDLLGSGGEIGLAVERRENGAAHQSRAAQAGQDRAGKPLHRKPAPIDQAARAAVHRKRRLVAEIDDLGVKAPMVPIPRAAQPSLVQSYVPSVPVASPMTPTPRPPPPWPIPARNLRVIRCFRPNKPSQMSENTTGHDAPAFAGRQRDQVDDG